jgi:hypothetical protein
MDADYGRNRDRDVEATKAFEPSLFVWATVMSRPAEGPCHCRRRPQGACLRLRPAARLRRARRDLRACLRRARPPRRRGRHQPPRAGRQTASDPRSLRPDRQPLRLVCLHPQRPRRATLADHRPRGGLLMQRPKAPPVKRAAVISPAFRPCATRQNTWLPTRRGSSAPPTMRQDRPSGGRCSKNDCRRPVSGLRRVRRRRVRFRL